MAALTTTLTDLSVPRTVLEVRLALSRIADLARHSAEAAHIAEDQLHADVLAAIAAGLCEDPRGCARAALQSSTITFPRGCASPGQP